jgi:hypothetical protein
MSNISWPDYGDLFPLVTVVVCYIALLTSGLTAILDRPPKPNDCVSRKREPANAKLSTIAPLLSRLTALSFKDSAGNGIQLSAPRRSMLSGQPEKRAPRYRSPRRFPPFLRSWPLALRLGFKSFGD